jgi:hypothetical protein
VPSAKRRRGRRFADHGRQHGRRDDARGQPGGCIRVGIDGSGTVKVYKGPTVSWNGTT